MATDLFGLLNIDEWVAVSCSEKFLHCAWQELDEGSENSTEMLWGIISRTCCNTRNTNRQPGLARGGLDHLWIYHWGRAICMYIHLWIQNTSHAQHTNTAREASWRRAFEPCGPLLFILYHYLEQNLHFGLVPETQFGVSRGRYQRTGSSTDLQVDGFDTRLIPRSISRGIHLWIHDWTSSHDWTSFNTWVQTSPDTCIHLFDKWPHTYIFQYMVKHLSIYTALDIHTNLSSHATIIGSLLQNTVPFVGLFCERDL